MVWTYLALFFVAFTTYRSLISREFGVSYFRYGYAVLEAFVIAKVILIGKALGLSKRAAGRTLALSVLRASLLYGALVAVFAVVEHVVEALFKGKTFAAGIEEILTMGAYEIFGRALLLFVAFIPFFALWELGDLTGEKRLVDLFSGAATPRLPADARARPRPLEDQRQYLPFERRALFGQFDSRQSWASSSGSRDCSGSAMVSRRRRRAMNRRLDVREGAARPFRSRANTSPREWRAGKERVDRAK